MKGSGTPQELPWFKGMENELNKTADTRTSQLLRDATARGIRGGTLEQVLKVPQEQSMQEILRAILGVYQQNPQQTMPWVKSAMDRKAQMEQMEMARRQAHNQESQQRWNKYMQLGQMGMGAAQGGLSMSQQGNQFDQIMKMLQGGQGGGSSGMPLSTLFALMQMGMV
jgi:hypothetical protein